MKQLLNLTLLFPLFLLLASCNSDCQVVDIEKAEWVTRYEDYSVDTLASYSVVKDYINFDESYSSQMRDIANSYNNLSDRVDKLYNKVRYRNYEDEIKNLSDAYSQLNKRIDNLYSKSNGYTFNDNSAKNTLDNLRSRLYDYHSNNLKIEYDNYKSFRDNYINVVKNEISSGSSNFNELKNEVRNLYNSTKSVSANNAANHIIEVRREVSNLYNSKSSSKNPSGNNKVIRIIEIRNNSDFAASFAVKDNNNFYNRESDFQVILPHSTKTFQLSWSISWNTNNHSDFQSDIVVLQKTQQIKLTSRIDELHLSTIKVNTCEQSVQALKREYTTVKDLYYAKVDTNGQPSIRSITTNKEILVTETIVKKELETEKCTIDGIVCWNMLEKIEKNLKTSHNNTDIEYVIRICNKIINSERATQEEKEKARMLKNEAENLKFKEKNSNSIY